ncbi:MAG: hypothetical protein HKN13_10600, partial [Rhodothermales bacterium]|nr:hypothetical protein [Rhodothermales bacterium]
MTHKPETHIRPSQLWGTWFFGFATTVTLFASTIAHAQSDPNLEGYRLTDVDRVEFVFSEEVYGVQPRSVVVTGEFRGWTHDLDSDEWKLKRHESGVWRLAVDNEDYSVIPPNSTFKYRIDDGEWLSPPAAAPNQRSGNL